MNVELSRLKSFANWDHKNITKETLALNGFFYTGLSDIVECYFCGIRIYQWSEDDNVYTEHKKWSPSCSFLYGDRLDNIALDEEKLNDTIPFRTSQDVTSEGVINENMNDEKKRLDTFKNWPISVQQSGNDLSAAGFFYTEFNDTVQCYSCGVKVRNWIQSDNPWKKHTTDCAHIRDSTEILFVCKICFDRKYEIVVMPCAHLFCCEQCSIKIDTCPICRKKICEKIKVYMQ